MQLNNQPNTASEKPGSSANLRPDIVSNIPIKAPSSPLNPIPEDDELDKIMQDVGKDLKKVSQNAHKKHFFEFKHHPAPAKPAAKPPVQAQPAKAPQPKAAQQKLQRQCTIPVFTITVTIIVTGFLIAAAYSAYK